MGLDMYLTAEKSFWDYMEGGGEKKLAALKLIGLEDVSGNTQFANIKIELIYWRKANAIHQWFVNNVCEGMDDCQDHYVEFEQLEKLLELCKKVKECPSLAGELLPTQKGFFFGSTEYDDGYFQDIEYTIERLCTILDNRDKMIGFDIEYHSSW